MNTKKKDGVLEMPYIIFLNGPPRCGKDTLGLHLYKSFANVALVKLSWPLKRATYIMDPDWPELSDVYTDNKDDKHRALLGDTYREFQIRASEEWLKPSYGQDVLGRIAVEWMRNAHHAKIFVITDSGFAQETYPITNEFGANNCLQIQITRPESSFDNDSRDYWQRQDVDMALLDNDDGLTIYRERGFDLVEKWIEYRKEGIKWYRK